VPELELPPRRVFGLVKFSGQASRRDFVRHAAGVTLPDSAVKSPCQKFGKTLACFLPKNKVNQVKLKQLRLQIGAGSTEKKQIRRSSSVGRAAHS
jgi:hypothetical protein